MPTRRTVARVALAGVAAGVVVAVLTAGCSTAQPGTPVAGDPPVTGEPAEPQPPTSPPAEEPTVDRPRPIDLTRVDVCQVVAALPLRDYGLDGDRPPLAGNSGLFPGAKDCFANGVENNLSLLVVAVTDQGVSAFAETATVAARSATVAAGYPLTVLTPRAPGSCIGLLDVHDGQMLYISYALGSPTERPVTPQARLCRTIPAIAAAAVEARG